MTLDDFSSLKEVISDKETMKYYKAPYDDNGVNRWISWCLSSYQKYGFGLYAVVLKDTNKMIGDCGISMQKIDGEELPELGYHLSKKYHRLGLATEMNKAMTDYFFNNFDFDTLYSYMTDENEPSYKTAEKNGMTLIKKYKDDDQLLRVYALTREEWKAL